MKNYKITEGGRVADSSKYTFYNNDTTLHVNDAGLILDFSNVDKMSFTGQYNYGCFFKAGHYCTFNTQQSCIFNTYSNCTFNTIHDCIFKTLDNCTFNTGDNCTFMTFNSCTLTVGKNCVLLRQDTDEIINLRPYQTIKLNDRGIKGYTIIGADLETIEVNGRTYLKTDINRINADRDLAIAGLKEVKE